MSNKQMEHYIGCVNSCTNCGGDIIGDGFTSAMHCENAEDDTYEFNEPDANVVECTTDFDEHKGG